VHLEHELCGIIHLDLLLYPLELSSIAIKVLNILAAHEHREMDWGTAKLENGQHCPYALLAA
jgi:hypothetical protein